MTSPRTAYSGPELVPGTLRGYRTWRPTSWDTFTRDVLVGRYGQPWLSAETTAECHKGEVVEPAGHAAPHPDCSCGIYAYYRPSAVVNGGAQVFGVVEASGRILMGSRGFRAERARILALVADDATLAVRFPDVALFPTVEGLLAEYPPDDVTELVGEIPDGPPSGWTWAGIPMMGISVGVSVKEFNDAMARVAQTIAETQKTIYEGLSKVAADLRNLGLIPDRAPDDPKQRALELRRQRNTGPPVGRYRTDGQRT